MKNIIYLFIITLLFLSTDSFATSDKNTKKKIIVELFTSQGCPACPPGEAFFNHLSKLDGVLSLSYHVDYWDDRGWKDPYSSPYNTARQALYVDEGQNMYTPNIVINGTHKTSANNHEKTYNLMQQAFDEYNDVANILFDKSYGKINLSVEQKGRKITKKSYDLWLLTVLNDINSVVTRGPNRGRTMKNYNVVKNIYKIGSWSENKPFSGSFSASKFKNVNKLVLLVQEAGGKKIIAAKEYQL